MNLNTLDSMGKQSNSLNPTPDSEGMLLMDEAINKGGKVKMVEQVTFLEPAIHKTAQFSDDHKYRFRLSRWWDSTENEHNGTMVLFVMLNPSTANEFVDDPTIRRCIGFVKLWGYSHMVVLNLFSIVSSDPKILLTANDPIGIDTDEWLRIESARCSKVIVAWGEYGNRVHIRVHEVLQILTAHRNVYCLKENLSGQPIHPLYAKSMPEGSLILYERQSKF